MSEKSIKALEEVMGQEKQILLATQKNAADDDPEPDAIYDVAADIYAPCALGATLNPQTLDRLKVKAVCGAANNQLATADIGDELFKRGILYSPDYVINGGGIINVASEMNARQTGGAYDASWVEGKLSRLMETFEEILERSVSENKPTHLIADAIAEARIKAAADKKAEAQKV